MNYTLIDTKRNNIYHCRAYRAAVALASFLDGGIIIKNSHPLRKELERQIRQAWLEGGQI